MSNKARSLNKYYIKQYVINDISCQEWVNANWDKLSKENKIIGYLFTKQTIGALTVGHILNLYLLNKRNICKQEVSKEQFTNDWELFLLSIKASKEVYIYVNPPIENWLDTKDNWCKKMANKLSTKFDISFSEALSNVYYSIMICYNKKNVYMGNLNYIERTIENDMLMSIRNNKIRVNQDSGLAVSMNVPIGRDNEGKDITIEDTLFEDKIENEESLSYQSTLDCCKRLMSDRFSPREIDTIIQFEGKSCLLPRNTYVKLLKWRSEHKIEEVLNE